MHVFRELFSPAPGIRKNREYALILFCGIGLTSVVVFSFLLQPLLLSTLDLKIYDALLTSRSGRTASGGIVLVDIDTKSLGQYGQWPWPRYRVAELMEKLRTLGALSIGVDILFAEPDRNSLRAVQNSTPAEANHGVGLPALRPHKSDNDTLLAEALRKGLFVLGYQFLFGEQIEKTCTLHPVNVLIRREEEVPDSVSGLFTPTSVDCIYRPLAEASPASGFFNIRPDHDGITRRVPLIMEYGGRFYPHLSLAVFLSVARPETILLTVGRGGTESLSIDTTEVPLERNGAFLIPFRGPRGTYRHISASDILGGTTERREIEGRIVLIGVAAPGLSDVIATPTDLTMPGVEVHANIIDALLQRDFLALPKAAVVYELLAIVFLGLLSTILFLRWRAAATLTCLILFSLAAASLTLHFFRKGLYLSPLYPMVAYTSNFLLLSILDFWWKERLVREKTRLHMTTQEAMLETIANITETRDQETGFHIRRTRSYVKALAEHLRSKPAYAALVNEAYIERLCEAAPLHDLGKVGVPDHVLLKTGRLTAEEIEEIKKHTQYGKAVIDAAQAKLADTSFLKLAGEMAFSHHEHWDGKGYPTGLKGEEIPLSGRIMAIADVYDALISGRSYKGGLPHEEAVEIMMAGRGTQFDPQLIDAFVEIHDEFRTIAEKFGDAAMNKSDDGPQDP